MEINNRKISFSTMLKKENENKWDTFIKMHPKQILCGHYPINSTNDKINSICTVGKVEFSYVTKHGKHTKDIRMFILNYAASEDDINNEFEQWIAVYNHKYSYRALLNHKISNISIYNLNDKKILNEIQNFDNKSKKRIIINKCNENNIIVFQVKTEYVTERQKKKESIFALPIMTSNVQIQLDNKYMLDVINSNRQRKVLNVKILNTTALAHIGV